MALFHIVPGRISTGAILVCDLDCPVMSLAASSDTGAGYAK